MGARIAAHDWTSNPIGPPEQWPDELTLALNLCLHSAIPTAIYWGPDLRLLYNDAWAPIPAEKHPGALGQPAREVWSDIWSVVGPQFEQVLRTGEGVSSFDQMLPMERGGRVQETYWNYSLSAIRGHDGGVLGIFNQGNETTAIVLSRRAQEAETERLREMVQQAPGAIALLRGPDHVFELANPQYQELTGHRDLVGRKVADALPEVVPQGFIDLLDSVYRTGQAHVAKSARVSLSRDPRTGPEERLLDFVYQPVRDAAGHIVGIFVDVADVTEERRAVEALRESETRFRQVSESAPVMLWMGDPSGKCIYLNRALRDFWGVSDETFENFDWGATIHPDDAAALYEPFATAMSERTPFSVEARYKRADGAYRIISTEAQPRFDDAGRFLGMIGVNIDVTEARKAEADLRNETHRLSVLNRMAASVASGTSLDHLVQTITDAGTELTEAEFGAFFYNVQDDSGESYMLYALSGAPLEAFSNFPMPRATAIFRPTFHGESIVRSDDILQDPRYGKNAPHRGMPEGHLPVRSYLAVPVVSGTGEVHGGLFFGHSQPGQFGPEHEQLLSGIAGQAATAIDRTRLFQSAERELRERRRVEDALRQSEARLRGITNSIDQMIWSTRPDGYHDYFNDRWYEYTCVPHGSTDGEGWNDIFHPDDQERAWALWRQCLASGDPYHIEYRLRHRSGQYRWVLGRAQAVRDADGNIERWFGTCTDIQDIVEAREVLARSREDLEREVAERTNDLMTAEEQLRQSQKMEAVGQLTGGIAHDFNNMLAVVIGALNLLRRRMARGESDLGRYIDAAMDGATRAASLTQRLLAFSRQQPLSPEPVDANRMMAEMGELLMRTLGEQIRIETVLAAGLWRTHADPIQLQSAILNLSVNARDAMPDGGRLTIETANTFIDDPYAREHQLSPGQYVMIAVTDTGTGMTPEVVSRAFDPFFTTKSVGKGTGLGLSQVFGFIRQSGGHVKLYSELGIGTAVKIYLPRYMGAERPPVIEREAMSPASGDKNETILVVEDEERVRAYSVEALRELGYNVIAAPNGPEALRLLDGMSDKGDTGDIGDIALLFTDVIMPDMTGAQLAKLARQRRPDLKVLYTTGYTRNAIVHNNVLDPGTNFLPKPFSVEQLATKVRSVLDS